VAFSVPTGVLRPRAAWVAVVVACVVLAAGVGLLVPLRLNYALAGTTFLLGFAAAFVLGDITNTLHLLVASMFVEGVSVQGYSVGRIIAIGGVAAIVVRLVATGWRPPLIAPITWLPAFGFVSCMAASGFWAASTHAWAGAMAQMTLGMAYFASFVFLVESPAALRRLMRTYAIGALAAALLSFWQARTGVRAVGLQGDPNIFALYEVAGIPVTVALSRTSRRFRRGWLLVAAPLLLAVLAAQSRGGLVAAAVAVIFVFARGDLGGVLARYRVAALGTGASVIGAAAWWATQHLARFSPDQVAENRGTGRLDIWYTAWHTYLQHPFLGIGSGNFEAQSIHLMESTPGIQISSDSVLFITGIRVHNIYLESLTELGPVGVTLWLAIVLVPLALLRWGTRTGPDPGSQVIIGALTPMLVAFATATVFLSINNSKLLWSVVGATAALYARGFLVPAESRPAVLSGEVPVEH
jgi:O-antigen ligase